MRILSIDWDYFINATYEQRARLFPDGGNERIMGTLSDMVWSSRYVDSLRINEPIENISIREKDIECLRNSASGFFFYLATDSHKYLGQFILENLDKELCKDMEIINIDHHSDLYNIGEELNCGNWLNKVFEVYPNTKLTWICNTDSDREISDFPYSSNIKVTDDLSIIKGKYDIIYLCKSSIWTPPHLDKYFSKLDRFYRKRATEIYTDLELPNRWTQTDIQKNIEETKKAYARLGIL